MPHSIQIKVQNTVPDPSIHTINLHGPWKLNIGGQTERLKFPCPVEVNSAFELSRVFHQPTMLSEDQIVALRFEFGTLPNSISLNDQVLQNDPLESVELMIAPYLQFTNEVVLRFSPRIGADSPPTKQVFQIARLEIHPSPDFRSAGNRN